MKSEKEQTQDRASRIDLSLLSAPFPASDIEWRVQRSGVKDGRGWVMLVAYIDARAVQSRLDDVCGPHGWRNEFAPGPDGGVLAGISVKVDGEWVTKWDGAENTAIESVKGGLSDALKRAAVQWGIGRYLYKLESKISSVFQSGDNYISIKTDTQSKPVTGYWSAPKLPPEFLPAPAVSTKTGREVVLGTVKEEPEEIEDPATALQRKIITSLYREVGGNESARDGWIGAIKTRVQAEQAIQRLRKQKEAMTDVPA